MVPRDLKDLKDPKDPEEPEDPEDPKDRQNRHEPKGSVKSMILRDLPVGYPGDPVRSSPAIS